jgi:hypothetical protein
MFAPCLLACRDLVARAGRRRARDPVGWHYSA